MTFSLLHKAQLLVQNIPWRQEIGFLLFSRQPGVIGEERDAYVTNVEFQTVEPGEGIPPGVEPTFRLGPQDAQTLIDDLWRCGLRPSEGSGSAGALRAVEAHLEDMRRIVGKKLDVELERVRRR